MAVMSEDSLPRKARESRRLYEEQRKRFGEALNHRREEIEAAEGATDAGDETAIRKLLDLRSEQLREILNASRQVQEAAEEVSMISTEAAVEGSKLRSDTLKQQATFSAGAIVGIATIDEVLLPFSGGQSWMLWAAYLVLLLTTATSLPLLHYEASRTEKILMTGERRVVIRGEKGWWQENALRYVYGITAAGFPLAAMLFIAYLVSGACR